MNPELDHDLSTVTLQSHAFVDGFRALTQNTRVSGDIGSFPVSIPEVPVLQYSMRREAVRKETVAMIGCVGLYTDDPEKVWHDPEDCWGFQLSSDQGAGLWIRVYPDRHEDTMLHANGVVTVHPELRRKKIGDALLELHDEVISDMTKWRLPAVFPKAKTLQSEVYASLHPSLHVNGFSIENPDYLKWKEKIERTFTGKGYILGSNGKLRKTFQVGEVYE